MMQPQMGYGGGGAPARPPPDAYRSPRHQMPDAIAVHETGVHTASR